MPDLPPELERIGTLVARAAPPAPPPPASLRERTLAEIERQARGDGGPARSVGRRSGRRHLRRVGPALAAVAAAVAVGLLVADDRDPPLELRARLSGPDATATAEVRKTGIGRVISFRSGDLPILPTGEYYELWFVGPGDRPGARNRISAGTFHPDEDGRSQVTFAAAVDPAKYPTLVVTAEPADGDPRPSRREVLRAAGPAPGP